MEKPGLLRRVGNCGAYLELDRAWIAWEGTLEGRLILTGGDRAQDLIDVGVWLLVTNPQGVSAPATARRWGRIFLQPMERLELPFSLPLGWGQAAIGGPAAVRAVLTLPRGVWLPFAIYLPDPPREDVSVPIQVLAPADFAQTAAVLGELTSLTLGGWKVLGKNGAAVELYAGQRPGALRSARLTLRRDAVGCLAEVAVDPLRGLPARAEVRLPAGDPEGTRQTLAECLGQFQYGVAELPIPAGLPGHDSTTLPRPATGGAPSPEQLPLPSELGTSPQ